MTTRERLAAEQLSWEPLSKVLMPAAFEQDGSGVIILADYALGLCWEIDPLPTSHLSGDAKDLVARKIAGALNHLPDHAVVQFLGMPTGLIEDDLAAYGACGGGSHPLLSRLEAQKIEFLRRGREGLGIPLGEIQYRVTRIRIVATLTVREDASMVTTGSAIGDALARDDEEGDARQAAGDAVRVRSLPAYRRIQRSIGRLKRTLLVAAGGFEAALTGCGMRNRRLIGEDFMRMVRVMLHRRSGPYDALAYDPCRLLQETIPNQDVVIDQDHGLVRSDGMHHRLLSISGFPAQTHTGMFSEATDVLRSLSIFDYITDGVVAVNISATPRDQVKAEIEARMDIAAKGLGHRLKQRQIIEELELVQRWVLNEQRRMLRVSMTLSMAHEDPRIALQRIETLQAKLRELGFIGRIEQCAAPSLWMQQLPFGFLPTMPEAKRAKDLNEINVADILPIYLEDRGTGTPQVLALNRRGEPFGFDFFDSHTGFHAAVFGESGAGKSFLLNGICLDNLRRDDTRIFIIDKGRSYQQLVGLMGPSAQFCTISLREKTCINVFAGTFAEASAFLIDWLGLLAARRADDQLSQRETARMAASLRHTYRRKQIPDVRYRVRGDIEREYPRAWIDHLRKRLIADFLGEDAVARLLQLKADERSACGAFEIYYRFDLLDDDGAPIAGLSSLEPTRLSWIRSRLPLVGCDEDGVHVLAGSLAAESVITSCGARVRLDGSHLVVDVAERGDLEALAGAGLVLRIPDPLREAVRLELAASTAARFGEGADPDALDGYVGLALERLGPGDWFDRMEGTAVVQQEVFFHDCVQDMVGSGDPILADLAERLSSYCGDGAFAGFFDGPTGFDLTGRRLICWECEELFSAGIHLVGAILGALTQMITLYAQSRAAAGLRKTMIIDEYGEFRQSPVIERFVEKVQRQGRKHGFSVVVATQSVTDLAGTKVMELMQHVIIGMQRAHVVEELPELIGFSLEQTAQAASVFTAKGLFSEFLFVRSPTISEVFRIVAPPLLYWCFTTDPADRPVREEKRRSYQLQGYEPEAALLQALVDCAEAYPNGIAASRRVRL